MWDADGKEYIDIIGGISVCNIGHRHPAVVKAIKDQADAYLHIMVYGELVENPQVNYAKKLTDHLPASLNAVFYTASGSEATEGAMKLAKRSTGRTQIVSFKKSYHGSTQGALSIMGSEYWQQAFRPLLPDILQLNYNHFEELQLLTDIGEKTRSIIVSMNDMIWAVKPENDKLLNLVQYMEDFGVGVAEAKNMAFSLNLANDMGELKLKMVTRKNLYYIFKESVNNSVKYSKATSIKVEIAKVKKEIVMVITDNGIGFDFETVKKGNGLTNIKKRGEEMGGRVEINSNPDSGTVVKVFLRTA